MIFNIALAVVCLAFVIVVARSGKKRKNIDYFTDLHPLDAQKRGSELYYKAKEHLHKKQFKDALRDVDQALSLEPQEKSYFWLRAKVHVGMKNYDDAIQDCETILDMNDYYHWAYAVRGEAYLGLKQYDEALADFEHTIHLKPEFAEAYFNRFKVYVELKKYEESQKIVEIMFNKFPDNAAVRTQIAVCYLRFRQYDRAIEHSLHGLNLPDPDLPETPLKLFKSGQYFVIGRSYLGQKNYEKALHYATKLYQIDPDHPDSLKFLMRVHKGMKNYDPAEALYEKFFKTCNEDNAIEYEYAHMLFKMGKIEKGLSITEKLVETDPTNVNYLHLHGLMLYRTHQYDLALNAFSTVLEHKPENYYALHNRALVYRSLSQFTKAWEDANKALNIEGESPYIYELQADLYFHQGDFELALNVIDKGLEENEPDQYLYLVKAYCYIILENHEQVDSALNEASERMDYDTGSIDIAHAIFAQATNRTENSQKYYIKAIEKNEKYADFDWLTAEFHQNDKLFILIKEIFNESQH